MAVVFIHGLFTAIYDPPEGVASVVNVEAASSRGDPAKWLVMPGLLAAAHQSLETPARTIQPMTRSVVEILNRGAYLGQVRQVLDRTRAAGFQIQPDAGQMLMMNDQRAMSQ